MKDRTRTMIAILIGVFVPVLLIVTSSEADPSDEYNYYVEYELENTGTSAITAAIRIPVAASSLVDGGFIQDDAEDCEITYLGDGEYLTAMDLSASLPDWRTERVTIPADSIAKKIMWFGNAQGSRNQSWIAAGGDTAYVVNPGSFAFSGTQSFTIITDITPQANPGTSQYIFKKGESYELSLISGPAYQWRVWAAGAPTKTATLSATIDTKAHLIAWYNGPGQEIVLCDSIAGECVDEPITTIQSSGSPIAVAQCDCIIDDLAIRTPQLWENPGTPPALPPIVEADGMCASAYSIDYNLLEEDEDYICDTVIDNIAYYISTDDYPTFDFDGYFYATNVEITGTPTAQLSGISFRLWGENNVDSYNLVQSKVLLPGAGSTTDNHLVWDEGDFLIDSGTLTQTPNGTNWTVEKLQSAAFIFQIALDYTDAVAANGENSTDYDFVLSEFRVYARYAQ